MTENLQLVNLEPSDPKAAYCHPPSSPPIKFSEICVQYNESTEVPRARWGRMEKLRRRMRVEAGL